MAEQILSQEEIDALLGAMDNGEVDLKEDDKSEPEAKAYDITSKNLMLRDQFYTLEEVHEKHAKLLQTSLTESFKRVITVEFVSTEMVKYTEFIDVFSEPTYFNMFSMNPLIGSALISIEPELAFSLVDCMFGGVGKPLEKIREFSPIEINIIRKFSLEVLKNMEKAWEPVFPVNLSLKEKSEINPEYVRLVPPNDLVMVVIYSLTGEQFSGKIYLCISYLMLEPIKDKLSYEYLREAELENTWSDQFQGLFMETDVNITAELGINNNHTFRDLMALKTSDVIRLDTGPQDPVSVFVEGKIKYQGFPGVIKGNRAVQVKTLIQKNGGKRNYGQGR